MSLSEKDLLELKQDLLKEHQTAYNQLQQIEGSIKLVDLQIKKIKEKSENKDDSDTKSNS